jgi:hypothetical protein
MTDNEPIADILARLQESMRPHAANPVTARRKVTDTPPPNDLAAGYGTRKNTMANVKNGGHGVERDKRLGKLAYDAVPVTARPDFDASVHPSGNRRIAGPATVTRVNADTGQIERVASAALESARASGAHEGMRMQLRAQQNLAIAAGEMPGRGIHFKS